MAVAYTKIPVTAGQILAAPTSISVSRRSNVMAITIPLTSGVIVQAFRVTPTGLVAIPVNGQPAAARLAISVSPDGTYIFVGSPAINQPAIEGWKYNTATGEYDKIAAFVAANDTARWTADIEWLSDNVLARISAFQSGSTYRGGVSGWRINANDTLDNFFNRLEPTSYRAECGRLSPNGNTLLVGFSGALNLNDSYSWDGNTLAFVRRITSGGSRFFEYLRTSDHIFASRTGSGAGLNIIGVATIPGGNIITGAGQNLSSVNGVQTRVLSDEYLLNHSTTGPAFFLRPDPTSLFAPSGPPPGLEEVSGFTSQWTWATNPSLNRTLAGYANGTTDLRVYINPIEPADVHLFAEAPAASATITTTENLTATFFALAPAASATIETLSNTTVDLFAMAPVATATVETQANTTVDLFAQAPAASATMLVIGSEDQTRFVVPMTKGVAVLLAEPVQATVAVLPRPYIRSGFGALRSASAVSYHMDATVGVGFGSLASAMSGAPDPVPTISVGFGGLYSAGLITTPVDIDFKAGFGALSTAIEIFKPSMSISLGVGFGRLESVAEVKVPITAAVATGFSGLRSGLIAASPERIDMQVGFGSLSSTGTVFVPIQVYGAVGFGAMASLVEVFIPTVARVSVGFQSLQTLVDVLIPTVARVAVGFQPLQNVGDVMVPNTGRMPTGFQSLQNIGEIMVPTTVRMPTGFQSLQNIGYVMVPSVVQMSVGFGALASVSAGLGVFTADARTGFGALSSRLLAGRPVKLEGRATLPFLEADGDSDIRYFLFGDFTLPFAQIEAVAEVSYALRGDAELFALEGSGSLSVNNGVYGDVELPGLEVTGSVMLTYKLDGFAVLPYLEIVGRGEDSGGKSPVGNAPTLIGASDPNAMFRTGGGIFLNTDTITIG